MEKEKKISEDNILKNSTEFDTSKMEALVFGNEELKRIYNNLIDNYLESDWGYHRQENIMNHIYITYILNNPKYLKKYQMVQGKEKKRRDQSGINQIKKEYEERAEKSKEMKLQAQKNQEEKKSEEPKTEEITETTGAGSSGQYSSAFAWSKDGKPHGKPMIPGSTIVQMNEDINYLINPIDFKNYYNRLNEETIDNNYTSMHDNSNDGMGVSMPNKNTHDNDKIREIGDNTMLYVDQDVAKMSPKDVDILHNDMTKKHSYFPHEENENLKDDGIINSKKYMSEQPKEIDSLAAKIEFITNNSDAYGNEIKNMDKENIELIYKNIKQKKLDQANLKTEEIMDNTQKIDEKAKSKAQQQFMGIVHAIQKGEMKPGEASEKAQKAAKEMKLKDVEDFASTKHENLPKKVNEDNLDTTEFLVKSDMKKIPLSELLKWSMENVLNSKDDPELKINEFAKIKNIKLDKLLELVEYYLYENLNYDGVIQTKEQEVMANLFNKLNDMVKPGNIEQQTDNKEIDEDSIIDHNDQTMATSGNNPSSMKMKEPVDTGSQNMETGIKDNSTNESININEMKKINQKGYQFYLLNKKTNKIDTGWEYKEDANDAKNEKSNPEDFIVYSKQYLISKNLNPDDNKSWLNESENVNELDIINEELESFKVYMENLMKEDRKPSALVLLDRLRNTNVKNFDSDFKETGTNKIVNLENTLQTKKNTTVVGEKPYENGEKIEKEVLDKTKGEALKNEGDSANETGDEITKRNLTSKEENKIEELRGGLHTVKFDNQPNEKYEKRMKEQMRDFYERRQKYLKANDKSTMDAYEKNQPVTIQKESYVNAKYKDNLNKTKFIGFNLNETKKIDKIDENYIKLYFDGLGNKYDSICNINESVNDLLNKNEYYINTMTNEIFYVNRNNKLNENDNKNIKKDINIDKIKSLSGYNPNNFLNTKNVKFNRGF